MESGKSVLFAIMMRIAKSRMAFASTVGQDIVFMVPGSIPDFAELLGGRQLWSGFVVDVVDDVV